MATILELADYAGVPAEDVLRRLNGEPVGGDVAARVDQAVEALGAPPYPRPRTVLVPADDGTLVRLREQLLESLSGALAENGQGNGNGNGSGASVSLLYEALRVEVRPVADQVSRLGGLLDVVARGLAEARRDAERERRERIDDLELMVELITSGWRMVDRRLGRVEKILQRLESKADPL